MDTLDIELLSSKLSNYGSYSTLNGPYILHTNRQHTLAFHPVFRLYVDSYRTFLSGSFSLSLPTSQSVYHPYTQNSALFFDPVIPVPSRLYYLKDKRPLAGKRIAVKDIYDVNGLVTAAGNRAWATFKGVANDTARSVKKLLNAGAVIVGKTKTAEFASGAQAWGWLEVQYPFNPRGDGWLSCSASSSGSACALATYEWLDFSLGTDTGQSIRMPASFAGVYGGRPSVGIVELDGVVPLGKDQDTLGFFARDTKGWKQFAEVMYSNSPIKLHPGDINPRKILYSKEHINLTNPKAQKIIDDFVSILETEYGMEKQVVNFTEVRLKHPNKAIHNFKAIDEAREILATDWHWELVEKPLIDYWGAREDGRRSRLDPTWREVFWENSQKNKTYTDEEKKKAESVRMAFVNFFNDEFLGGDAEDYCSNAIMLLHEGTQGLPMYREQELNTEDNHAYVSPFVGKRNLTGFEVPQSIASAAMNPDFTLILGEVEYESQVTHHTEWLPVAVSVLARRGCDFMLFRMFDELGDRGVLKTVRTGRRI
ncbi:amidase signature enzyme [Atractiella rhizophila]|nr:amidase signature enzyme [Atractiella rhizophila]